jgi:alanine racemase
MIDINPCAEINLTNYKNNLQSIKSFIKKDVEIMAIVKANAYGHGAVEISKAANEIGIRHFGVATLEEGIELRENNIIGEILILGQISPKDIRKARDFNLTLTLSDIRFLNYLKPDERIKIHIKIDTGLSRNGFYMQHLENVDNVYNLVLNVKSIQNVELKGIYTHYASAESNETFTVKQLNLFSKLISMLKTDAIDYGMIHTSNSAATLLYPETHFDMVRIGLLSYGINITNIPINVHTVMRVKGTLIQEKNIKAGDKVGYGLTYTAKCDLIVGIVNLGYADGISRQLSNKAYFTLNGTKVKCIGRISMDVLAIDITNCSYNLYDDVVIFGEPINSEISINQFSKELRTIDYEVLCSIGNRVKRKIVY